jgi:hypothetical protein
MLARRRSTKHWIFVVLLLAGVIVIPGCILSSRTTQLTACIPLEKTYFELTAPPGVQSFSLDLTLRNCSSRTWNPAEYKVVLQGGDPTQFLSPMNVGRLRPGSKTEIPILITLPTTPGVFKIAAIYAVICPEGQLGDLIAIVITLRRG